jgi:hypothetical protein
MQMIEQRIFPTLVGKFEDVLFPEQCDELVSFIDTTTFKEHKALIGDSITSFDKPFILDELPEHISSNIFLKIDLCIKQYVEVYGCAAVRLKNTWISYQYHHSKLKKHTHPGGSISGVLYLRADENSSPIYFYNPNPFASFTTINDVENPFTREHVKVQPKTGDLLIFPSWLAHGSDVDENMSKERIILSFNAGDI